MGCGPRPHPPPPALNGRFKGQERGNSPLCRSVSSAGLQTGSLPCRASVGDAEVQFQNRRQGVQALICSTELVSVEFKTRCILL